MKITNNMYGHHHVHHSHKKDNGKKAIILGASLAGMLTGMRVVGKMQKLNAFTWSGYKKIDYNEVAMTIIAGLSLIGGVGSGILLDKKNTKSKLREASQQLIGNIIFPIFSVTYGKKLFDSIQDKIKMPQIKSEKNLAKMFNHASKHLPQVLATAGCLGVGLVVGNKFANLINNSIFERKEKRKLRFSDLSGHVDDVCVATTLVAKGTKLGDKIARFIPPALIVPGYVAGTKTVHNSH